MRILTATLLVALLAFAGQAKSNFSDEEQAYGKLTVYSDIPGSDIYVDAKFVGQDKALISNIEARKHYVRVTKEGKNIQSGLVEVAEGEETIIIAKAKEEDFVKSTRKSNYLTYFGGYTAVGYSFSPSAFGYSSFYFNPQFGVGADLKYPLPVADLNVDIGFLLNAPTTLNFYDSLSGTWKDGKVSVSSPYVCLSRELAKLGAFKINAGGGFNYALFTPGGGVQLSVEPGLGFLFYLEGFRNIEAGQKYSLKAGYMDFAGRAGASTTITSAGYFLQLGLAYQL